LQLLLDCNYVLKIKDLSNIVYKTLRLLLVCFRIGISTFVNRIVKIPDRKSY